MQYNTFYRCKYCGRVFIKKIPHLCNKCFTKHNLKFDKIIMENKYTLAQFKRWGKEIEAFEEGKQIQIEAADGNWRDIKTPTFSVGVYGTKYQIKPEPKYRPYNKHDKIELLGKVVVNKASSIKRIILAVDPSMSVGLWSSCEDWADPKSLLKYYTFADGTPCGILDE